MWEIKNSRELEYAQEFLRIAEKVSAADNWGPELQEKIIELKRAERKFRKNRFSGESRKVKDYGIGGYLVLSPLPDMFQTDEDAKDYFEKYLYIAPPVCAHDCTGKAFTSWYKIFKRNGRYWVYHRIAFDC